MIIRFRTEGAEKTQTDLKKVNQEMKETKTSGETGAQGTNTFVMGLGKLKGAIAGVVAVAASFMVVKKSIGAIIETASQFESLENRLVSLYGDVDRASQAFEKFRDVASRTPATLQQVVQAGTQLKAFGLDAENTLEAMADLSAYMGVDIVQASEAVGRAFAGGYGASEILRERGVLELIKSFNGIDDLSKYTLPEFREVMLRTFQDPASGIAGSAERLSKTFQGAVSNMQDSWDVLKASLGEVMLPSLTPMINQISVIIEDLTPQLQPMMEELSKLAQSIFSVGISGLLNITKLLTSVLPPVIGILSTLTPIFDGIVRIVSALSPLLTAVSEIVELIMNAIAPIIQQVLYALSPVIEMIGEIVGIILQALSPALTSIMNIISNLVGIGLSLIAPTLEFLVEGISGLANVIMGILGPSLENLLTLLNLVLTPLNKVLQKIMGYPAVVENASESIDTMAKEMERLGEEQTKSVAKYEQLAQSILNEAYAIERGRGSKQNLSRLMNTMNQQYGTYLKNLNLEKTSYNDLNKILITGRKNLEQYWNAKYILAQQDQVLNKIAQTKSELAKLGEQTPFQQIAKWNKLNITDVFDPNFESNWTRVYQIVISSGESVLGMTKEEIRTFRNLFLAYQQLEKELSRMSGSAIKASQLMEGDQPKITEPKVSTEPVKKQTEEIKEIYKTTYDDLANMELEYFSDIAELQGESYYNIIQEQKSRLNEISYNIDEALANSVISQEQANELKQNLADDYSMFLIYQQKEMQGKLKELAKYGSDSELDIIREKYESQKAEVNSYLEELKYLASEPIAISLGLDVNQLNLDISQLEIYLAKIDELEQKELDKYQQNILQERANAYLQYCQDLVLTQEEYMAQKAILIDAEIEKLKELGFAEYQLNEIRKGMQTEALKNYEEYVKDMWERQLGDAKEFIGLIKDLSDEFLDNTIDILFESTKENKKFWDSMLDMIEEFVINAIKEINKYIAKLIIAQIIKEVIGVPAIPGVGSTSPGMPAEAIGTKGYVPTFTPTYVPISQPVNQQYQMNAFLDRLEDIMKENQPQVYTQLIEGVPLRNAIRKAEIKANIL